VPVYLEDVSASSSGLALHGLTHRRTSKLVHRKACSNYAFSAATQLDTSPALEHAVQELEALELASAEALASLERLVEQQYQEVGLDAHYIFV
jgi:hypothetical protein